MGQCQVVGVVQTAVDLAVTYRHASNEPVSWSPEKPVDVHPRSPMTRRPMRRAQGMSGAGTTPAERLARRVRSRCSGHEAPPAARGVRLGFRCPGAERRCATCARRQGCGSRAGLEVVQAVVRGSGQAQGQCNEVVHDAVAPSLRAIEGQGASVGETRGGRERLDVCRIIGDGQADAAAHRCQPVASGA